MAETEVSIGSTSRAKVLVGLQYHCLTVDTRDGESLSHARDTMDVVLSLRQPCRKIIGLVYFSRRCYGFK